MRPECDKCYYNKRVYKKENGCVYFLTEGKTRTFIDDKCACRLILNKQEAECKYREYQDKIFASHKAYIRRDV